MDTTIPIPDLVNLPILARQLRVSQTWLRQEAEAGRIPSLSAGCGRYLFSRSAVETVLLVGHELAGKKPVIVRSLIDANIFDTAMPMPATPMQRASARLAAEADAYQREMDELHRGGSDRKGVEHFKATMQHIFGPGGRW